MLALIEKHLPQIERLCVDHHVLRLELFGSAVREAFDPASSDLDFFVEFEDLGWEGSSDLYFGLLHGLEDLLGKRVDLVELKAVRNRFFLQVANRHRQLLYAPPVTKAS